MFIYVICLSILIQHSCHGQLTEARGQLWESSLHCMNILNQTQIVKIGSRYHLPIELSFATHVFKDHNNEEKIKSVIQNSLSLLDYIDTREHNGNSSAAL